MKIRKVTYYLQLEEVQQAYILQELQKCQVMFRWIGKDIKRHKNEVYTQFDILQKIRTYCRTYHVLLNKGEEHTMVQKLLLVQKDETILTKPYVCENGIDHYKYHALSLYPFMKPKYYWQLQPLVLQWRVVYSALYPRGKKIYLILYFECHK